VAEGNTFVAFGIGALVGFGIREVVGWLGNLVKTMFPSDSHAGPSSLSDDKPKD